MPLRSRRRGDPPSARERARRAASRRAAPGHALLPAIVFVSAALVVVLCYYDPFRFYSSARSASAAVRRFGGRFGGSPVVTLPDFFPRDLAEAWRRTFEEEWRAGAFQLATNNNGRLEGSKAGGNAKYRSHERASARREIANSMNRAGHFSYAKHELPSDHDVLAEISAYMLRNDTRHRIAAALNVSGDQLDDHELSDLFATSFGVGDFLSMHSDGFSGTYAFVASLANQPWRPEFGGALEMFCRDTRKWCGSLAPTFNSLVVFKTRQPVGPPHRVAAVLEEADAQGWRRHGFTGWYRDVKDVMTAAEMRERDAMRGRNS